MLHLRIALHGEFSCVQALGKPKSLEFSENGLVVQESVCPMTGIPQGALKFYWLIVGCLRFISGEPDPQTFASGKCDRFRGN
jgi:hypothetical protein